MSAHTVGGHTFGAARCRALPGWERMAATEPAAIQSARGKRSLEVRHSQMYAHTVDVHTFGAARCRALAGWERMAATEPTAIQSEVGKITLEVPHSPAAPPANIIRADRKREVEGTNDAVVRKSQLVPDRGEAQRAEVQTPAEGGTDEEDVGGEAAEAEAEELDVPEGPYVSGTSFCCLLLLRIPPWDL